MASIKKEHRKVGIRLYSVFSRPVFHVPVLQRLMVKPNQFPLKLDSCRTELPNILNYLSPLGSILYEACRRLCLFVPMHFRSTTSSESRPESARSFARTSFKVGTRWQMPSRRTCRKFATGHSLQKSTLTTNPLRVNVVFYWG